MVFAAAATQVHAAGYSLMEQTGTGLGNAYAGMAARSDDASLQFYNPANLAFLQPGTQISFGGNLIFPKVEFEHGAAVNSTFGNSAIAGNDGGDAGQFAAIPNFYFAADWNDRVKYGVGVSAPFGLSTSYRNGWLGRYHALESELRTVNINPAVAWKATDYFSMGGGISVQYADAGLTNAIDSSGICLGAAPLATCTALGLAQPGNAAADSRAELEGDDFSWGYNFGFVYQPAPRTSVGAAYRSHIKHTLAGEANFKRSAGLNTLLAGSTQLTDTDLKADLSLPEIVSLSLVHGINDRLELLGDITWTNWSRFKELRIRFDNPAQADGVTTTHWDDSLRFSVGANYLMHQNLKLRVGVAYDQSPVPDAEHRTPRIPDQDRIWLALGASWKFSPNSNVEIGYAHIFIDDAKVNNTTESAVRQNLQGTFTPSVNILSAQFTHEF